MKKNLNFNKSLVDKIIHENDLEITTLENKADGKQRKIIPKALKKRITSLRNYNQYLRKYK